ncbi:MAG: bacterial Ig-like domain-containing protein, partial [Bacteroidales bacterium]|nr:bacterial Ig-like domain-containing protein [Bacteroidales bacterium]
TADNPYKGIFTTDTFAISGLYVNDSKQNYVGLFGYYAPENIQYVYYINVKDSYFAGHDFVGGLFGYVNSEKARLSDFYFRGEVSGNSNVGGLFGKIDVFESLSSGYVSAKVTGSSNVGSVCGYLDGKTENNSFDYLYYDTQLCSLGAINGTDDVENNIIGKNTFHTGEVANLLWLRQDLSDPSSFPEFKGQFVHKNLSGSGYHNPEYEDHHCKYCINYTYSLPQLVDGVYQISTADELYGFMHIVNTDNPSANAVLTADIVVNEKVLEKVYSGNTEGLREWYSIGNDDGYRYGYYDTFCPFVGVFDGNFHIISGLYFDNFDNQLSWVQFGLFGTIYNTVKNVILNDTYFKTSGNTGGIVGYISDGNGSFGKSALIENCIFDGEIISEGMGAGICKSIVSSSNIKNCINFGTLTGSSYSGGIVGADWSGGCGNIENCYNVGKIVCKEPAGEFTSVGGICGGANIGNISNCYNTGSISSGYGVYGWNWSYRPLTNIYNNSDICNLPISYYHYTGGNLTTAQLCNGTLPEGFSSDDWIPGKTVTADDGTITYTFPHLKVFDGKYPAHIITKPGVKAIAIKTPPTQTEYALGDDLSKVGLVVTFTYSDHTTIDVDYYGSYDQTSTEYQLKNSLMDSDFDFDNTSTGKKTVTVRYQDLSAQFEVNVVDRGVCGYQYLDEDGTLTFYYGKYRTGAGYIGANGCSKPFNADDVKKAVFDPSFKDFKPTNLTSMLGFYPNLQEIVDMDKYLNTEEVTSMAFMFAGYQLTTLDLSTFDTRKVENMSYMFNDFGSNKSKLQTIYVGDKWSTDNVKGSTAMFGNCPDLVGGKGTKNADLPHNWTDEVSYACVDDPEHGKPGLFTYKASTPVDPREPYALLTDNGETVTFYYDANKSQHQDALGFDGDYWNFGWQSAKVAIFDESFKEYKPTSCAFWFYNCTQLTEISHLDYLNTEDVTEMQWMFMGCENLESIDVSKFNTSKVTNMPMMFCNCHKITELDLSSFDNSQFANNGLVMSCHNLTTIYVEDKWINHRVGFYFSDCPKLIGGQGTLYNVNNRIDGSDALYARIDGGESAPGYFTRKGTTKPEVKSIAITTLPKTAYVLGEELNTDNGELAVTIGNRNPQPHDFQGATVTGYDKTKEGKQTLTVEFLGATTTYDIEIAPLTPIDTIFTAPTKLSYIEGEDLDLTGGYFTIKFNNLETEKITLTNENATISGFDNAKIGEQTISVDYFPNTFTFTVNVEAKTAIAIEITQLPTKLEYLEGEEFVPDGGELIVTYNNKTSETLELAKATITGFDSNTIGEQTVTVDYLGQKAEFKAKVKRKNPYEAPVVIDDVYQITKAQDLFWFVIEVNNGNTGLNAALTNDIVINQDLWKQINKTTKAEPQLTVWKPIGTEHSAFSGTFDGQGHTISGIYINDETQSNVGLFGVTTETAVIKNLGVTDSYISGNENVGAICGKSEGTVVNCYTVSEVVGNKNVNPLVGAKEKAAVVQNSFYLADSPKANDPCAKTAEQFKSGEVAAQLAKGATINGVTYSGESFAGLTELPGTENIEVISDPENPPTPVSEISPNINVNVWSYNHIIYIDNAPDAEYRIIDLNGRLITTSTTKSTKEEIQINKSGILIVIIGNQSFKVSL